MDFDKMLVKCDAFVHILTLEQSVSSCDSLSDSKSSMSSLRSRHFSITRADSFISDCVNI